MNLANLIPGALLKPFTNAGAPTDGTSGTWAGSAPAGALLIDTTNFVVYQNKNTLASPSWEPIGGGVGAMGTVEVRNESGGTYAAGTPVYISGWSETQDKFLVTKADADASGRRAQLFILASLLTATNGVAASSYRGTVNGTGSVALDLAAAAVGDPVYLATVAGECVLVAPSGADDQVQILGQVAVVATDIVECLIREPQVVGTNELAALAVTTAKIAVGAISADAAGRALFAADVFDATTVDTAFATGAIGEDILTAAEVTGRAMAVGANANVIGAIPVLHRIDITAGALADTDVVLTHKTRVIDAWLVLRGAGVANTTLQVKNGASAITDAMAASGADTAVVRAATIDDAQHEIAAAGTLRVTSATGATQPDATVYVLGVRVA